MLSHNKSVRQPSSRGSDVLGRSPRFGLQVLPRALKSYHMGTAVRRGRHGLLCYERQDRTIGASIRMYGEWAEEEIFLLSSFLQPGGVVLDVGAHVGTHALAFARFVGPSGTVIAIDAQARAYDLLVFNVALNDANHIRCVRALVGKNKGLSLLAPEGPITDLGAMVFYNRQVVNEPSAFLLPLPMITLDDLALRRCDLIKIDIEGMELDALVGAQRTIAHHRPPIYFEQARAEHFAETFALLRGARFNLFWHVSDPFNRRNFYEEQTNIFGGAREVNVLALPQEKAERYKLKTSGLQPITTPIYDPPPRNGPTCGWTLPENAYDDLPPVAIAAIATRIAESH